ncbi:hypothetical protein Agabi119p4_3316 [Agaricus bisporus var. burnettii]|uniref:Uncharacterized protein n=1 Tax=Agaricus bisporus var. burnettii TaxID=192524 RepID=A0A8H7KJ96_AGABI|nr:hypothetical protein Agabi119p4_3316 [Agaricus bisporus var. burnettii]
MYLDFDLLINSFFSDTNLCQVDSFNLVQWPRDRDRRNVIDIKHTRDVSHALFRLGALGALPARETKAALSGESQQVALVHR